MKITVFENRGRDDRRLEMSIGGNGLGVVRGDVKREELEHRVSEANRHINREFAANQTDKRWRVPTPKWLCGMSLRDEHETERLSEAGDGVVRDAGRMTRINRSKTSRNARRNQEQP